MDKCQNEFIRDNEYCRSLIKGIPNPGGSGITPTPFGIVGGFVIPVLYCAGIDAKFVGCLMRCFSINPDENPPYGL